MKAIYSTLVVFLLLCQAQLVWCTPAMANGLCANNQTAPDMPTNALPHAPTVGFGSPLCRCDVVPSSLTLAKLGMSEPIRQEVLLSAPLAYHATLRQIDPPPRSSYI